VLDGNEVRAEVETGLKAVCACGAGGFDLMCCGTMGRIETLAVAADRLDRDDLRAIAQSTAAAVVRRAQEAGGYRLAGGAAGSLFPDLFCGLPGIGYQLLRLGFPERVPSVLLWH
jgi:lantibiotic modifying enzyme